MPDPTHIHTWRRLDHRITTSGQPSENELAELQPLGVRHVLNLGLHSHERALADEAGTLAALGIAYHHIPVPFDAPGEGDFARFCEIMASIGDAPVHVHCILNMRVSAFIYRWQREVRGVDEAQARALMDRVWRPGGVWAAFVGDAHAVAAEHGPPRHPSSSE